MVLAESCGPEMPLDLVHLHSQRQQGPSLDHCFAFVADVTLLTRVMHATISCPTTSWQYDQYASANMASQELSDLCSSCYALRCGQTVTLKFRCLGICGRRIQWSTAVWWKPCWRPGSRGTCPTLPPRPLSHMLTRQARPSSAILLWLWT